MPHRTVFQWGKNHAHPFTTFMGGVVIGALVTGAAAYAWEMADETNEVEIQDVTVPQPSKKTAAPSPVPQATASSGVQF